METKSGGRWSIPEAANVIKAIFFVESIGHERLPTLRYSQIREVLRREKRPISPRSLSRALDLLESRKEITREEVGRQVRYSLALDPSREETISTWANADSMLVQEAARLGGIGDRELGWAFYGFPLSMKSRLRSHLKTEVEEFQYRVDSVLEDEARRLIRSIRLRARDRVPKRIVTAGERGLWGAFERMAASGLFQVLALTELVALDRFAPGAVTLVIEKIGEGLATAPHKALVELAKRLGEPEEEVEKELRKAEDDSRAIDTLLTALRTRDREDAARRFGSLLATRANLCAVVR